MRRFLPHPFLAVGLLVLWLTLQQSIGLGHVLMGSVVAIAASIMASAMLPDRVTFRRPVRLLQLLAVAGLDIMRSNLALLAVLLHPRPNPTASFIEMELKLTHPFALAILACLLTATPGSAWLDYDGERGTVLIHVFDLVDEEAWVAMIRTRYEALLLEIFE